MKLKRHHIIPAFLAAFMLMLTACEEVITLTLNVGEPQVVVEGIIENDRLPYVILSRSFPFFGDVNINAVDELIIRNAIVTVTDGRRIIPMVEYDLDAQMAMSEDDFNLILQPVLSQFLGFKVTQSVIEIAGYDISIYSVGPQDIDFVGVIGKNYWLDIQLINDPLFGTRELSAKTFIPFPVSLDSLWVEEHPLEEIDTLFQLRTRLDDPDTSGNYYRYFNRDDDVAWLTPGSSAFDDAFLDGESVPFTVIKGQSEADKLEGGDFDVIGYWSPGDSAQVKLSSIDQPHYEFWRTVENEKGNLGNPFGSFAVISSNVEGGVGIWGGYSSTTISIVIPEEL